MSAGDTNLPHGAYHAPWFNGCGGSNETNDDMIDVVWVIDTSPSTGRGSGEPKIFKLLYEVARYTDIAELGLSKKEFVAVGCAATTRAGARRRPYRGILQHAVAQNRIESKYRTLAQ